MLSLGRSLEFATLEPLSMYMYAFLMRARNENFNHKLLRDGQLDPH
jgi:hypothetical protein